MRKIKSNKPISKMGIKKIQKDISHDINVSKITNQNLQEENLNLLQRVDDKKIELKDLDSNISKHIKLNKENKEKYEESKEKLDNLCISIQETEKANKEITDEFKETRERIENKKITLEKDYNSTKKILEKKFKELENSIIDLKIEIDLLSKNKNKLKDEVTSSNKIIESNLQKIKKQNESIKRWDDKRSMIENEYISIKVNRDIIKGEKLCFEKDIRDKKKELSENIKELNKVKIEIKEAKIESERLRELNMNLIQREERLKNKEKEVIKLRKKAGLST